MLMAVEEIEKRINRISDLTPVIEQLAANGFKAEGYLNDLNEMERLSKDLKNSGYRNVSYFGVKMLDVIKQIKKLSIKGYRSKDLARLSEAMEKSVQAYERLPKEVN